jgi:hypothetical protein
MDYYVLLYQLQYVSLQHNTDINVTHLNINDGTEDELGVFVVIFSFRFTTLLVHLIIRRQEVVLTKFKVLFLYLRRGNGKSH